MTESMAEMQKKFNDTNNRLAECQVSNVRLSEFNSQLHELFKGSKLAHSLESVHLKDKSEQAKVFTDTQKKESLIKDKPVSPTSSKSLIGNAGSLKMVTVRRILAITSTLSLFALVTVSMANVLGAKIVG